MSDDLVEVFSSPREVDGELVKARLEDEGIPVLLKGAGGPYPTGPVHVLVSREFEEEARRVIGAIQRGEYAV